MKDIKPRPETPPLTRAGRKLADAASEAAKFRPTADGKRMVRQFEAQGIRATEWVNVENTTPHVPHRAGASRNPLK
jgi:hypothetical protein